MQYCGNISSLSQNTSSASNSQKDSSIYADNAIFDSKTGAQNLGTAVFKDDKLIGELNAIETLCMSILKNDVKSFLVTIPNPEKSDEYIDIEMHQFNSIKIKVDIINGSPYIKINGKFSGRILSADENNNYLNSDLLNSVSNSTNDYLKSKLLSYLYKTSKNFKSDINNFGNYALSSFLTTKDFEKFNWKENYKNAVFEVSIDSDIKSSLLLTKT